MQEAGSGGLQYGQQPGTTPSLLLLKDRGGWMIDRCGDGSLASTRNQ